METIVRVKGPIDGKEIDSNGMVLVASMFFDNKYIANGLDLSFFGNNLGFNSIEVFFLNPIPMYPVGNAGPAIVDTNKFGIVVATDINEDKPDYGFHNYLIPWSNISNIRQYIAT